MPVDSVALRMLYVESLVMIQRLSLLRDVLFSSNTTVGTDGKNAY